MINENMNINTNSQFYNNYWSYTGISDPERWGHWSIIRKFLGLKNLEIGPGNKPKIPIKDSYFIDINSYSLKNISKLGGKVYQSDLQTKLPFDDDFFDLVCSFETLEHLPNDKYILKEMVRVLKNSGTLIISLPVNSSLYNAYDRTVGHFRRYDVDRLDVLFKQSGISIKSYAFLDVKWPGNLTAGILSILSKKFLRLLIFIQNLLDLLPGSALTKKIILSDWSTRLEGAGKYTTIFLLGKKIRK